MKNQSKLHRAIRYIKTELEVTLAALVLLAFVVGFSFAQTPTSPVSSEITAVQSTPGSQLTIGTTTYSGIIFGAKQADGYKTITKLLGEAQYYDETGITLVNTSADYKYTQSLSQPLDATPWYLDFEGSPTTLSLNGQPITSPTQALNLAGATNLQLIARGNLTLRSISQTPGTASGSTQTKIDSVASLYIAPATTQISVGATRKFIVVALTSEGQSISAEGITRWSSSNPNIASIEPETGLLTAISAGKVQITARTNSSTSASATVTVIDPAKLPTISNSTAQPVEPPIPFDIEPAVPFEIEPAIPFEVEPPVPFTTHPTQAQINAEANKLPLPQQIIYRATAALTEIKNTVTEITIGRTVTDPKTGETMRRPSAIERIGSFFGSIF